MGKLDWNVEFTAADYEVPTLIEFLVRHDYVDDLSWHNDTSPSFGRAEGGREVRLCVDHQLKSAREAGGKRFMVTAGRPATEATEEVQTDDLEEAVHHLDKMLKKYGFLPKDDESLRDLVDDLYAT